MKSSQQLKTEKTALQTELDQTKARRIEATLSGTAFNENDQITTLMEQLTILDEAIIFAEKREAEQREFERQQQEIRNRQAQKAEAYSIATRGNDQIKKAEAAAIALVEELSKLTRIFEERRLAQRAIHGPNHEINIDNDEIAISDLIERLFGTIYNPNTNDRRTYGRFHWGVVGSQDWSQVFESTFNGWAAGVAFMLDRKEPEVSETDDNE